jgi:hypothetical protein
MRFTTTSELLRSAKRSETKKMRKERLGIETDAQVDREYKEEKNRLKETKHKNSFFGKALNNIKGMDRSSSGGRVKKGLFSTPRNIFDDNSKSNPWIGTQDSGKNIWTGTGNNSQPRKRRRKNIRRNSRR